MRVSDRSNMTNTISGYLFDNIHVLPNPVKVRPNCKKESPIIAPHQCQKWNQCKKMVQASLGSMLLRHISFLTLLVILRQYRWISLVGRRRRIGKREGVTSDGWLQLLDFVFINVACYHLQMVVLIPLSCDRTNSSMIMCSLTETL